MPAATALRTRIADAWFACRRCLYCAVAIACAWTVVHVFLLEEYQIPTGSMAPTLRGLHRVCACPRCGQEVAVGRHYADTDGSGRPRFYRKTFCPNCGLTPLDLDGTEEIAGDRVIVNKAAYRVRAPARWEIVVLRLFGCDYIKRLLGLPGETVLVHDGDLYVNGLLKRKTYAEAKRMRVLIYDQDHAPPLAGAACRWTIDPAGPIGDRGEIVLDGTLTPATLAYQNVSLDSGKCEPLRDEYAYNAGLHADCAEVHDFLIETELQATAGAGVLAFRLCDGHDWVEVRVPMGAAQPCEVFAWPIAEPEKTRQLADSPSMTLRLGQRYRLGVAFVDRRLSLTIDDRLCHQVDLPEAKRRNGVALPFQMQAEGVCATLHSFRLYRDVHYGQQGRQAVHGKMVQLGVDQYFVLGDNSPHSEDSRHWPDEGRVPFAKLIGPLMWAD